MAIDLSDERLESEQAKIEKLSIDEIHFQELKSSLCWSPPGRFFGGSRHLRFLCRLPVGLPGIYPFM